jgi:Reverse transcriptase (RNA-dependent DNA polymerase)
MPFSSNSVSSDPARIPASTDLKRNLYITIWVDDLLMVGKDGRDIANVKAQLSREFEMKDLARLEHFLAMRITKQSDGDISIDQNRYIHQILERFDMESSKAIAPRSRFMNDNATQADVKQYQARVRSLMYTMLCTRPDLAYAIQQLSQFNANPTNAHFQAAKLIFRYRQGSQTMGLIYGKHNGDIIIQAYCDADYAADRNRKSISRYFFTLAGSPISWQAKKQTTVAQSTVESEYAAMAHAAKETIWMQCLLKDLGMSKYVPTTLFCDNQGAISLAKNPTHHGKTKHVDVQLRFIRDHIEERNDQGRILPYRRHARGHYDEGTCSRKARTIDGNDGNGDLRGYNHYAVFIQRRSFDSGKGWATQQGIQEWGCRIMRLTCCATF